MQEDSAKNASFSLAGCLRWLFRIAPRYILAPSVFPVALLIDGDNHAGMSSELLAQILVEAGKLGGVVVRKVYGNWSSPTMQRWKDLSMHYTLEPVHYGSTTTTGKNGADIALALDALDLYRCHGISHFCLVASDSDYLPLVRKLRANGCVVVLIGKVTTSPALKASTLFVDLDHLLFTPSKPSQKAASSAVPSTILEAVPSPSVRNGADAPSPPPSPQKQTTSTPQKGDGPLRELLLKAYDQAAKDKKDEWVSIQAFHAALSKLDASFKLSNYQYKNFAALFQAYTDAFETRKQPSGHLAIRKRP